jgi:hypothetical protein
MNPQTLAALQGVYYTGTGVWPLLHMPSFLAVTGPKTDLWLVRTVGLLVTCIGAQMLAASRNEEVNGPVRLLAAASAASLASIDTYYAAKRRIRPVYLLDAVAEVALLALWMGSERR